MATIKLIINGNEAIGEKGDSVLDVCKKNDIYVPTLCHHDSLTDTGACRLCLVEIEGQRGYRPACCTVADDGMVVKTDTDEIKRLRRSMIEFLFSERNHFCMFCEASGDCELQKVAYAHGIEHAKYDYAQPKVRLDSSRSYFVFDENRCILCQRCVRACSEIAGHNVLDLSGRSAETRIIADLDVPFGESLCTSCGTCLQVCPTGALFDRAGAYLGRKEQCQFTKSVCSFCSVGCAIDVVTKDNHILRINGDWNGLVNKGVLCVHGRFEPIHNKKERLTKPMIKENNSLKEVELDEAINYIVEKCKELNINTDNAVGLISPKATNEEASIFASIFRKDMIGEFGPHTVLPDENRIAKLDDINSSDCILMYKMDPNNLVIGSFLKLAIHKHNTKLVLVDDEKNNFDTLSSIKIKPEELDLAKEFLSRASNPLIIYASGISEDEVKKLSVLSDKAKLMGFLSGANSRGLRNIGINGKVDVSKAKALYVLACDDELKDNFKRYNAVFVVLQTSYFTPEVKDADVILPSPIWAEKSGSITNIDGLVQNITKSLSAPSGVRTNEETMKLLIDRISS
ncbi:MAG: molybdopterin-dependent oxidoreductase [Candidatus Poribacteria bacterium]